jgi:capsular exopolysaccharide synthesis family protein
MKLPAQQYPYHISAPAADEPGVDDGGNGYYYPEQAQDKHLRDYWNILVKRLPLILTIFCGTVALGVIVTLFSPTEYSAKSTLKIEPQNPSVTGVGGVAEYRDEEGAGQYDYYQTQFVLLKSSPLAARVIGKLDLGSNPSFESRSNIFKYFYNWIVGSIINALDSTSRLMKGESRPQRPKGLPYELGVPPYLVGQYLRFLTVTPIRNTRLVDVTFETPDPRLSQQLANAHATAFIQMILENRFNLTEEAQDFLKKKLAELRTKVQKAENAMNQFRREHGIVSLEKGENIVVDRLMDINKELTRVRAERIQAESLYQMTRSKNSQYLAQVLNNGLIQQLKGNLAALETEKGRLSSIFTAEHPRMQELNQQMGEAKRALNAEINTVVQGIESAYSAARGREEALEEEATRQQQTALGLKQVAVDYAVLNEDVLVNRGLYDAVLKRLNETNVGNDLAAANIQVMQRAELPLYPSSPDTFLNLIISAFLGLLFALGTAFFLEYMDVTVNTPQQVWAAVSLATLGVVPHLKSLQKKQLFSLPSRSPVARLLEGPKKSGESSPRELVMATDQLSIVAESYRTIRTALLASRAESPPRSIVLTSPCPDEGKTITTLNLGMSLAQSGKRVVVIDADLRKGRCHRLINVAHNIGLVDVITGQHHLHGCIQNTGMRNLCLLTRGTLPPNPGDLLTSQRMRDVVRELSNSFDFVLIDSPPIIAVSDAAMLSTFVDGVLLVFHGNKTTKHAARLATEQLESLRAPIIGVILNGVDIRDPEYVDYRSYFPAYFSSMRNEFWQGDDKDGGPHGVPPARGDMDEIARTTFVPRQFIDDMIVRLNEALGGESGSIVRNKVATLRESVDAFPIARTSELVQLVSQEIWEHQRKVEFLRAMSAEIRELRPS